MKETQDNHIPYLFFSFTKEGKIIDCNLTFIHIFGFVNDLGAILDQPSINRCFSCDLKSKNAVELTFLNGNSATLMNIDKIIADNQETYYVTAKYKRENGQRVRSFSSFNQLDLLNHFPFILCELNDAFDITHIEGEVSHILGMERTNLFSTNFSEVVDAPSFTKLQMLFEEIATSEGPTNIETEITLRLKPESFQLYLKKLLTSYVLVIAPFPRGHISMAETMMSQYSSLAELNTELLKKNQLIANQKEAFENLSRIDSLTGLFNRRHFNEILFEEHKRSKELNHQMTILLIDLNNFKLVNDLYGHHTGDQLLKRFATIAMNETREGSDFLFRFGGDEFIIILTDCDEAGAHKIAQRIEFEYKKITDVSSLAYGAISIPSNIKLNVDKYLKLADERMYRNKKESKSDGRV